MVSTYEVIQVGEKLRLDDGHVVSLVSKIGDGFTAVVFIGEPEDKNWRNENIVIKIAKPQTETQNYVREEYNTLIDLSNRILVRGVPISPRVYGKGVFNDRFFIAMELLKGSPILGKDEIVKREEREALEAYQQIYCFLEELHTKGITYPDLKIENFFWDSDSVDTKLRVLDFGAMGKTLDPLRDPECHREIFKVGLAFFSSLTGRSLLVSATEVVVENLNEVLLRYELSYGTKLLLIRLLGRSKDHRLKDAKSVKEELDGLANFWNYDQETLFNKFQANLLRGEGIVIEGDLDVAEKRFEDKYACTKRAMSAIDIYQLRFGKSETLKEDVTRKLDALSKASSYLTEAKRLLLIKDFGKANTQLRTGEALAQRPEPFHLWHYLFEEALIIRDAQLGPIIEGVGQVIDSYENGKLEAAHLLITNLIESFPDTRSLKQIQDYIQFTNFENSSENARLDGDYLQAIEYHKNAQEKFKGLPNSKDLEENYYKDMAGRLKLLADEAEEQSKTSKKPVLPLPEQNRLLKSGDIKAVVDDYRKLLLFDKLSEDDQDLLVKAIEQVLRKGDIQGASSLAEIVNYIDEPNDRLIAFRRSIRLLLETKFAINTQNIPNAMTNINKLVELVKDNEYIALPFRKLFAEFARLNLSGLPEPEKNRLKEISLTLGDYQTQQLIENAIREDEEIVRRRITPIMRQIEFDLLPTDRWHYELDQFVDELQTKSFRELSDRLKEDNSLLDVVAEQIQHLHNYEHFDKSLSKKLEDFNKEVERRRTILKTQSEWLPSIRQNFEEAVNQTINEWKAYKAQGSHAFIRSGNTESLNRLLTRTIKIMTQANSLTGDLTPFKEIAADLLVEFDLQGVSNWQSILPDAENVPGEVNTVLDNVSRYMQEGQLQLALGQMQRLDPVRQLYPQAITLRLELLKMVAYEKSLMSFSEKIQQHQYSQELIELILEGNSVNRVYAIFKANRIAEYLNDLIKRRRALLDSQIQKLKSNLQDSVGPDEVARQSICEYIMLRQASRFVESSGVNHEE